MLIFQSFSIQSGLLSWALGLLVPASKPHMLFYHRGSVTGMAYLIDPILMIIVIDQGNAAYLFFQIQLAFTFPFPTYLHSSLEFLSNTGSIIVTPTISARPCAERLDPLLTYDWEGFFDGRRSWLGLFDGRGGCRLFGCRTECGVEDFFLSLGSSDWLVACFVTGLFVWVYVTAGSLPGLSTGFGQSIEFALIQGMINIIRLLTFFVYIETISTGSGVISNALSEEIYHLGSKPLCSIHTRNIAVGSCEMLGGTVGILRMSLISERWVRLRGKNLVSASYSAKEHLTKMTINAEKKEVTEVYLV
ncbi:hypothetical protein Tco_1266166 [Tanacetum coccineum]